MKFNFANPEVVGHTKVRCPEPVKEADDGGFGDGGEGFAAPAAGGGDEWVAPDTGDWAAAPAAATVGGGGQEGW